MESNTNEESIENFSELTYRQRFVVTEYGYLLSPENAEVVGKMLGNFREKDVAPFCQANGKKVSRSHKITHVVVGVFENPRKKIKLVLATFSIALAITLPILVIAVDIDGNSVWFEGISLLFIFPTGLLYYINASNFDNQADSLLMTIGGWLIFAGIGSAIILIKNRPVARILYFAFVILLILNITGCYAPLLFSF